MSCQICISLFTKRDRKRVICPSCEYEACAECVEKYLTTTIETPHCMSCRKSFSRKFMVDMCGKSYMNTEYKKHRENVLFNFEKALCPSTQEEVKIFTTRRELSRELVAQTVLLSYMMNEFKNFYPVVMEDIENRNNMRTQIARIESFIDVINFKLNNPEKAKNDRKEFIRGCPAPDCKGFLSQSMKCGLCDVQACARCHEVKVDDEHVCDPNSIETVKMLARDSKPCPKCASVIYKIQDGGCDQMYCVQCNTAFSWKTGRVCTGIIHNPHYFEYMRKRNLDTRNVLDVGCGGIPHIQAVNRATGYNRLAESVLRSVNHFQAVEMPKYNVNITNQNRNLSMRILWMINELSDDEFKLKLQQADKDLNKRLEIGQVMATFIQVLSDTLNNIIADTTSTVDEKCKTFNESFTSMRQYFNEILAGISNAYGCSVPWLNYNGVQPLMSQYQVKNQSNV